MRGVDEIAPGTTSSGIDDPTTAAFVDRSALAGVVPLPQRRRYRSLAWLAWLAVGVVAALVTAAALWSPGGRFVPADSVPDEPVTTTPITWPAVDGSALKIAEGVPFAATDPSAYDAVRFMLQCGGFNAAVYAVATTGLGVDHTALLTSVADPACLDEPLMITDGISDLPVTVVRSVPELGLVVLDAPLPLPTVAIGNQPSSQGTVTFEALVPGALTTGTATFNPADGSVDVPESVMPGTVLFGDDGRAVAVRTVDGVVDVSGLCSYAFTCP